jgi:hypothetical protein
VRGGELQLIRSGRLPITPQRITDAELSQLIARERERTDRRVVLIAPQYKSQLGVPMVSSDGSVWIPRVNISPLGESRPVREYLIVPLNGRAQYQVTLPAGFSPRAVVGDLLFGTRKTEHDVDLVQVWRHRR